jgi:hypothetical protein
MADETTTQPVRICNVCLHYNQLQGAGNKGECRRTAPTISLSRAHSENGRNKVHGQWPIVNYCDWCGDFFPSRTAPQEIVDWYMTNGHLF